MIEKTVDETIFMAAVIRAKEAGDYATNEEWAIRYAADKIKRLEQENARLLDICQVTRIMLRNVLRERDFGWCMGEVTEIVKRLDAVTALEEEVGDE